MILERIFFSKPLTKSLIFISFSTIAILLLLVSHGSDAYTGSLPIGGQQRAAAMERALPIGPCRISKKFGAVTIDAGSGHDAISYQWKAAIAGSSNWFGTLVINPKDGHPLQWGEDAKLAWVSAPARLTQASWEIGNQVATLGISFADGTHLALAVRCIGSGLSVGIISSRPAFRTIRFPTIKPDKDLRTLNVPYNPFPVIYRKDGIFLSQYFDWTRSNASRMTYPELEYGGLTDGTRLAANDRLLISVGRRLDATFPPQINPRSSWLNDLSGRVVLDIWNDKNFADVKYGLEAISNIGVGQCAVIIHMWQLHGFDNGLPEVAPANQGYGGDSAMKDLAAAVHALGCRLALHQNYVDYYPNYVHFDENDLIRDWRGKLGSAWLNKRANVQAYASRPDRFVDLAAHNSPDVHRRYRTDSSYIDQNSGLMPWWRSDRQADRPGSGRFLPFVENSIALWAYERKLHGGPVFGEGQYNFFWAGNIDAVEAQLSPPFGDNNAYTLPLLVNFDLTRIHGWSADHGMGYSDRWTKEFLTNRGGEHIAMMDIYRMQEIAFGHQPFLSGNDWRNPAMVWTEAHLIAPVARRYGTSRATTIHYFLNGKWRPVEEAIMQGNMRTVQIAYANGLLVTANANSSPIEIDGVELRQGNWSVRGAGIRAASGWVGGRRVEFVDSANEMFAQLREPSGISMDFGPISTDGTVSLMLSDGGWTLRVLPGAGTTAVRLRTDRFPLPATGVASCGKVLHPMVSEGRWSLDIHGCSTFNWQVGS